MKTDRLTTQDLLFKGITKLLQRQAIDKITVKDIINQAGVSRATFYRYYYDKYDLLNSYYEMILEDTLYRFKSDMTWEEAVYSIYKEIKRNLKFYQNAISSSDQNSLKNYIFEMSREFHLNVLEENGIDINDWKTVKAIESYIYGNLEIMHLWIKDGMKESIEDMMEVFDMGIPSEFIRYFK